MKTIKIDLNFPGLSLSRNAMKAIVAGTDHTCLVIGSPCLNSYECCSGACTMNGSSSVPVCQPPANTD